MSKGKLWMGAVVVAVVAVIGVQYGGSTGTGEGTSGTIAPAQRHRATQPGAADVKVQPSGSGAPTTSTVQVSSVQDAAKDSAKDGAKDGAKDAAKDGAKDAAKNGAKLLVCCGD